MPSARERVAVPALREFFQLSERELWPVDGQFRV